jgi:hypothetical protein
MEGVERNLKALLLRLRELAHHKIEVNPLIQPVHFVAHDRVAEVREVDADLMLPAGVQPNPNPRIHPVGPLEVSLASPTGPGGSPIGPDAVLDGHRAGNITAQGRVQGAIPQRHATVDQSDVLLGDQPRRP